uniref:lipopolysaccharide biosynthesis protein n=1 Tax=Thaumasiovibrio occultus TaxID=1891184 RepID=UPI000B364A8B|nr:lipopolysaccharide biosynthesis protein [Thaumasiovibrio occultus]
MSAIFSKLSQFHLPSVVYYAVALAMAKLVGLVMQPFLTRTLSTNEFGDYAVLITIGSLVSLMMLFGMVDSLYRQTHDKTTTAAQAYLGAWSMTVVISCCIALPMLLWPAYFLQWLPGDITPFSFRCLTINLLFGSHCAVHLAKLRLDDRAIRFFIAQAIFTVAQMVAILCLAPDFKVDGIMLGTAIGQCLQWGYLHHRQAPRWSFTLAKPLTRYGYGIALSGIISFIAFGAERWVLADISGTQELAIYSIAMQWAIAATLLLEPFSMWWFPRRFKDLDYAYGQRYTAAMTIQGCNLATLLSAAIITFATPFLLIWLPESYHQVANILPWLVGLMLIKTFSTLLNVGCYYQKQSHTLVVIAILSAIIALVCMWLLIPRFGIVGAIISGFIVQSVRCGLFLVISQSLLRMHYPYHQLLRLLGGLLLITCMVLGALSQRLPLIAAVPIALITLAIMSFATHKFWRYAQQQGKSFEPSDPKPPQPKPLAHEP